MRDMNTPAPTGECPPLDGLRVIEFGQFIAVPAAGQALSDLGADVIKVESPGGDPSRRAAWPHDDIGPMFSAFNRGKRSAVLDLASEEGRSAAFELAMTADIVLQNARPGAMARAGISPEQLRAAAPRLIVATVAGFSAGTVFESRPGFDIAAQAESGIMSINGSEDGPPTRVGYPIIDVMASHAVTNAVLAAIIRRDRTGIGASIEISLMDVATTSMAYQWAEFTLTGQLPMRSGNKYRTTAPSADLVATADGAIVLSAYLDEHFVRFAAAIGRPGLASDPRFSTNAARVANRPAMLVELAAAFAAFKSDELCAILSKAGVVAGAVRNFDEVRTKPNGISPSLFQTLQSPSKGPFDVPGNPIRIDGAALAGTKLASLGEHTDEVLAEAGAMALSP